MSRTPVNPTFNESLWQARVDGSLVDAPAASPSLADAYRLQGEILALGGCQQVGWKIGSTSPEAQARLGTDQPGAGPILREFHFGHDATVRIHPQHEVFAEVEFAFLVAKTLSPGDGPFARRDVLDAIGAFVPGIELVGSRFKQGLSNIGRELITVDGGGNVAFIGGNPLDAWAPDTLPHHRCRLEINGQSVAEGVGARALGDPVNVLEWLANHLSGRGIALEAGYVISTGTCTGLEKVKAGDHVRGDFGELGEVSFTLQGTPV